MFYNRSIKLFVDCRGFIMDRVKEILMTEEYIDMLSDFKAKNGVSCDRELPSDLLRQFSIEVAECLVNRIFGENKSYEK
jgi:hypothetical protein